MVFSSLEFLCIFLPLVLALYYMVPAKLKNGILLFFSLVFYAWGEPVWVLLMLFSILMNYLFGLGIDKFRQNSRRQKWLLAASVAVNLGMLGVFKYSNFAIDNINALFHCQIPQTGLTLPIGISFFTFQAMSYVIDVYRKKAKVQKNLFSFGLYISLFPQLIAGPIVRYSTVAEQIDRRSVDFELAAKGIRRFLTGLAKKVLIANNIGLLWSQISGGTQITACDAWLGALAFSFQLYFDFSGYSDMAIGLGHLFGFCFEENFRYPYISKSITEFWNRWHISLSSWFREYVYIPLGGNRKGKAKQIRNILIVWALTGLWHGASWNFVLWGLYYGVCLLLEKFVLNRLLPRLPSFFRHVYTLLIVLFGWVLFAFDNTAELFAYLGSMFGANGFAGGSFPYHLVNFALTLLLCAIASTPLPAMLAQKGIQRLEAKPKTAALIQILWYGFLALLCIAYLVDSTYNPFIYFRF